MIVITGAAGLVGANLVRALLAQGETVRVMVHQDRQALAGLEVEQVQGDILNPGDLRRAFAGAEMVYHAAGLISIQPGDELALEQVNVGGTRQVVDACLACGVRRLVHVSSIQALQAGPADSPVDENRPLADAPGFPAYDRSKAAAEKEVLAGRERGLETVILCPTAVVGPFDCKPSYFGRAMLMLARGRIPAVVKGGFDWVDARDLACGAVQAGRRAASGERYILSGHWHSVREVAEKVSALTGTPAPRLVVPMGLAWLAAPLIPRLASFGPLNRVIPLTSEAASAGRGAVPEPIYTRATLGWLRSNPQVSHAHAARDLGYQPRPFAETLADTLHWFIENGYLQ
jgi:dihydroflavonol-4-reductase